MFSCVIYVIINTLLHNFNAPKHTEALVSSTEQTVSPSQSKGLI